VPNNRDQRSRILPLRNESIERKLIDWGSEDFAGVSGSDVCFCSEAQCLEWNDPNRRTKVKALLDE
jgi:hypothetical protein